MTPCLYTDPKICINPKESCQTWTVLTFFFNGSIIIIMQSKIHSVSNYSNPMKRSLKKDIPSRLLLFQNFSENGKVSVGRSLWVTQRLCDTVLGTSVMSQHDVWPSANIPDNLLQEQMLSKCCFWCHIMVVEKTLPNNNCDVTRLWIWYLFWWSIVKNHFLHEILYSREKALHVDCLVLH